MLYRVLYNKTIALILSINSRFCSNKNCNVFYYFRFKYFISANMTGSLNALGISCNATIRYKLKKKKKWNDESQYKNIVSTDNRYK